MEELQICVVIQKGTVLNNLFFNSVNEARNYLKFTYPKRRFKEPEENTFVCCYYGTKFQIITLNNL